jgi:cation/acetate symporter
MMLSKGATGDPVVTVSIFAVFVVITLLIVYRVGNRQTTTSAYYTAESNFSGAQNGVALAGDWLSAASFLGVTGAIAVDGYDGFLYSVGFLVAWIIALLFMGEMVRNTGRFTIGDVIAYRMRQRPVRAAASIATIVISVFYMTAQMSGAGGLVALLLNVHSRFGQAMVIVFVGAVMIFYVLLGGMKGTTWVQIIKAGLLLVCVALMTVFLSGKFLYSFSQLLDTAANHSSLGSSLLNPGAEYGKTSTTKLDFVSLAMAIVFGVWCLPHVVMRLYTVPSTREARRSVVWITWAMVVFYFCTFIMGFGATALVGSKTIESAPGKENSAALLLSFRVGGTVLLGLVAAVAFATILAVVAGLTLTAASSFAHDIYANVIKRGNAEIESEIRVARITAVVIGIIAILGGILTVSQNAAFLVSLALALSASTNLSTIVYTMFWKRFNTAGTLAAIYAGLISSVGLILFSPVVSGSSDSMLPGLNFAFFPLTNPGIISIPLSFIAGYIGTLMGEREHPAKQMEMEVRAMTGIGSGLRH